MHVEGYDVSQEAAEAINAALDEGRPCVAVGTTVVRTLESAAASGRVRPGAGRTELFITPGHQFQAVDQLLTNFHTPGSSLLALVAAFLGMDLVRRAYSEAVAAGYRFFSYGDATLLKR